VIAVVIVMGSISDGPVMQVAEETLGGLGVSCEVKVLSAHRTPDALREWVRGLEGRGVKVVIAAAGGQPSDTLAALLSRAGGGLVEQWWQTPADLFAPPELAGPF
jgi:phosphoribosylaminoimidazole carboxylase PurE protein